LLELELLAVVGDKLLKGLVVHQFRQFFDAAASTACDVIVDAASAGYATGLQMMQPA
jgi:hypothetical protein